MRVTEKSAAEIFTAQAWGSLMKENLISVDQLMGFTKDLTKILEKTEELRKSRDNWRNKYEELKNAQKQKD